MGHKVGWLTLYAGVAGGADIILLPEIPYDIDKVVDAIHKRTKDGKGFTILAVAEGAISKDDAQLTKKQYKAKVASRKYPSVSYEIADQIQEKCGVEVRVAVPAIHSVEEVRAHTTECYVHGWVPRQPKPSWMESLVT